MELKRAVELEPTNGVALNNLAVTLNTLGREDEADEVYERALRAVKARMAPSLLRVESYRVGRGPASRTACRTRGCLSEGARRRRSALEKTRSSSASSAIRTPGTTPRRCSTA